MTKDYSSSWETIVQQIGRYRSKKAIEVELIDDAVSYLGDFAWEMGPYLDTRDIVFALSPGWDRDLLKQSEAVIRTAPLVDGVIIAAAKPPKNWKGRFQLKTDLGSVDVSTDMIGFNLSTVTNDEIEIEVTLNPKFEPWDGDITNIWIDSEIGEYNKVIHIPWCNIRFAEGCTSEPFALRRRFFKQFPQARYATDALRLASMSDEIG